VACPAHRAAGRDSRGRTGAPSRYVCTAPCLLGTACLFPHGGPRRCGDRGQRRRGGGIARPERCLHGRDGADRRARPNHLHDRRGRLADGFARSGFRPHPDRFLAGL
ncbi:MAG: hypothetical protein AVDCRST_MAG93-1302, partial [uncultured Chloroflexia bacterium]